MKEEYGQLERKRKKRKGKTEKERRERERRESCTLNPFKFYYIIVASSITSKLRRNIWVLQEVCPTCHNHLPSEPPLCNNFF
jgi:prophage antirepressor-like protein